MDGLCSASTIFANAYRDELIGSTLAADSWTLNADGDAVFDADDCPRRGCRRGRNSRPIASQADAGLVSVAA